MKTTSKETPFETAYHYMMGEVGGIKKDVAWLKWAVGLLYPLIIGVILKS